MNLESQDPIDFFSNSRYFLALHFRPHSFLAWASSYLPYFEVVPIHKALDEHLVTIYLYKRF
jgi:hypothetical protein